MRFAIASDELLEHFDGRMRIGMRYGATVKMLDMKLRRGELGDLSTVTVEDSNSSNVRTGVILYNDPV